MNSVIRIDDWFVVHLNPPDTKLPRLLGNYENRPIPFDNADFNGFRGRGSASDAAMKLLLEYPEAEWRIARLEMHLAPVREYEELTWAKAWVILAEAGSYYKAYGPRAPDSKDHFDGRADLFRNGLHTFSKLGNGEVPSIGSALYHASEMKRQGYGNIFIATWALHLS